MQQPATIRHCPPLGSISAELDLAERLRLFDFTTENLEVARKMWAILEPESDAICEIQLAQWRDLFDGPRANPATASRGFTPARLTFAVGTCILTNWAGCRPPSG